MAGRPRKVVEISTGKIGKQEKQERAEQEKKIKIDRLGLKPPKWLKDDKIAKAEFIRVTQETAKIDLLDNLDLSILAIYCKAYSGYVAATEMIKQNGMTALRRTAHGHHEVLSPYVVAQDKYAKQIMLCSSKLGLATTDRLKLIVPTKEDDKTNKFLKYLDGANPNED